MQMLAYGIAADCVDEYLNIGESAALKCLKIFCYWSSVWASVFNKTDL